MLSEDSHFSSSCRELVNVVLTYVYDCIKVCVCVCVYQEER